ncbi:reverse transcriptase [Phytophthora cinnamomi]|uniref:reverse transcriptase n=1 Tax=Phytophthora cinnamomi TaxID=4785 RepID=UPI00355AC95D|nr:reverse transcriptase [Phytophthora cinnamomi]
MASCNEAKNTHLTEAGIKVLLSWIEKPANFESIYGTSGKTTVGGKAKITKSAAYTQMAAHLRSKTKKYESLKPRNMQQRWENVVKKFREVLKLQGGTGMGLTAAEIRQGVSLPTKLEKMCPCFYRLEALFGERPNMNAHATVELGAVVCTAVTESVPTETEVRALAYAYENDDASSSSPHTSSSGGSSTISGESDDIVERPQRMAGLTSKTATAMFSPGASNNFVRLRSLSRLDFEEEDTPRSLLEVRLATGAIVKTEKRVVNVRFSYKQRVFVEHFIVLDLDDKFDVVMGMPWLARHDPVIDWKKRTLVRFGRDSGTESDGPVTAARAPAAGLHDEALCDQAGLDIARPQTGSAGEGHITVQPGCTKENAVKPGLIPRARGQGPPANDCPRPGLDKKNNCAEPGSAQQEKTAQAENAAQVSYRGMVLASPPTTASELTSLPAMSWKRFTRDLHDGRIEQVCVLSDSERTESESEELRQLFMGSTTESEDTLSAKTKRERFEEQGWDSLKSSPYYELLREYKDVLPEDIPAELPQDKGIQHEIDLVPGTKYCVTRQWPLPREQVKAIDDFFESRRKTGQVRESKSPHSAPTFCVNKPQGGWRIVHAYNKLNDATVPTQTPIPRKDVIIDSMAGSTVYSALDLRDGFYQILMRESDIPLTAVSTPSGMLWEWLVMPQGLKNALRLSTGA